MSKPVTLTITDLDCATLQAAALTIAESNIAKPAVARRLRGLVHKIEAARAAARKR